MEFPDFDPRIDQQAVPAREDENKQVDGREETGQYLHVAKIESV